MLISIDIINNYRPNSPELKVSNLKDLSLFYDDEEANSVFGGPDGNETGGFEGASLF